MSNIHAKRIGQRRWKLARKKADMIAGGFFDEAKLTATDPKETSFCGPRSQFTRCVPKTSINDWWYAKFISKK